MSGSTISYSLPQESGLSRTSVERLADSVANQIGFQPGGDLNAAVVRLGGKISTSPSWELPDSSSGSVQIKGPEDFEIFLSAHTGTLRDKFTIAHEIGHYIVHYLWPRLKGRDPGPIEAQRAGSGRVEWEANWFAAAFLMPEAIFRSEFSRLSGSIILLAERFCVSVDAARTRAKVLGLA